MNSHQNLGRLEPVDVRTVWPNEARDFTPWLAGEENISLLGDTLGMDLEVEAEEKEVGIYRADILCRDTASGHWVLVENQLAKTDHGHLGQLLTYAAGLDAVTIVWIASEFNDEHRAALDWLNDITEESVSFFGLEVEVWRIGESTPAPKFNVVVKPNDWKHGHALQERFGGQLSPTKEIQRRYWTALRDLLKERGSRLRGTKPPAQNWYSFSIGKSNFTLDAFANTRDKRIGVLLNLYGPHAKSHFTILERDKDNIEAELGEPLVWRNRPQNKTCQILLVRHGIDPLKESEWPEQHAWLLEKLEAVHKVFRTRVKSIDAGNVVRDPS